ncbi:hypothetical protein SEUCBS139899_006491 [Sporothrix eucalyptigena]|uniref:BAG domain-containing protein n=1 Tax=Sporothrix eucalyptigena TaxID=1812306 RepID=A0ABP0CK93_9PEZI
MDGTEPLAKVASGSAAAASLGAPFASLANITSALLPKLPPGLQTYLDSSVDSVATVLASSSSYIQSTTGIPPTALYSTVAGAVLIGAAARTVSTRKTPSANGKQATGGAPKLSRNKKRKAAKKNKKDAAADGNNGTDDKDGMRRYGWSTGQQLSPFTSSLSQEGVPDVTDSDFEYITSDDLHHGHNHNHGTQASTFDYGVTGSRTGGSYFRPPDDSNINDIPQEDVLLLRHGNDVQEEYFPAFSIGDGKLFPEDVRDRVQLIYDLSDAQTKRVKLYYKGRLLKNDDQPVCVNGVKNNSELLVVLPGEELEAKPKSPTKKGKAGSSRPDRSPKQSGPSASTGNLEVPSGRGRPDQKTGSSSRAHSAASGLSGASGASRISNISSIQPPQIGQGTAMEKLNKIAQHFEANLLPLCDDFLENTPTDPKKRLDEYRKISETVLQHTLLKLDEVDTGGDDATRTRRKALVNKVQDVLKQMDAKGQVKA